MQDDLSSIENSLASFHRGYFHHKVWEYIQARAHVQIERSTALTLKAINAHDGDGGRCRLQDVALHLGVEAPSVTRQIQHLERSGLVRRTPDTQDGRVSHVRVTARGKTLLAKLHAARHEMLAETLADWRPEDRRTFARLMARFADDISFQKNTIINQ